MGRRAAWQLTDRGDAGLIVPDDRDLAALLLQRGSLRAAAMQLAMTTAARLRCPLAEVLRAETTLQAGELIAAQAELARVPLVDPLARPLSAGPIEKLGITRCLESGMVPLGRFGSRMLVALARPADWPRHEPDLTRCFGAISPCLAPEAAIQTAIATACSPTLQRRAESRVPEHLSTRGKRMPGHPAVLMLLALIGLSVALLPVLLFHLLLVWVVLTLLCTAVLRATALALAATSSARRRGDTDPPLPPGAALPVISILVPLYGEPGIAPRLLQRLGRLDYSRALLDVVIVLEDRDHATRHALANCRLPGWMRVVVVPDGSVTTKPRAMNYALDFCRGEVIGIYDAEDAPDPDQLHHVLRRFAARGPQLACLQGALDYYNPRTNLLARLFTAEYAAWFRVVMPALQRLGLPMPLGGTTLFLRRHALEQVGAWDAHNVTEDADLGVRLARFGYRTEMLPTTTHEEANCHLRPWLRQRSRWIKGHLLTWAVHMRAPRALLRDLGWRGFLGYQLVFLGAQSQVLLAPVMWSFWLIAAGLPHPATALLPNTLLAALFALFLTAEALVIATAAVGLSRTRHPGLWRALPALHFYHPLAAIAGWRALWEAIRNPFYWAKTSHGQYDTAGAPAPTAPAIPAAERLARSLAPAADGPAPVQRSFTSPASMRSRVSKAREIWVRSAS